MLGRMMHPVFATAVMHAKLADPDSGCVDALHRIPWCQDCKGTFATSIFIVRQQLQYLDQQTLT